MRRRGLAAFALPLLLSSACTMTIGPQNPRPNIALVPQSRSLRLDFSDGVARRLAIEDGNNTVLVEGWDETLARGFANGFAGAYRLSAGEADLTLTLDEVQLEIGDFAPARARIQYKATLSAGGVVLCRSAGVVTKAGPAYAGPVALVSDLVAVDVRGAVEAMYERIAHDLPAR